VTGAVALPTAAVSAKILAKIWDNIPGAIASIPRKSRDGWNFHDKKLIT
jgi:hypothetical protein